MKFNRRKRFTPRIDIAPLVDVVFLLLLFFMLTSRMVSEPAILIDLPDSSTAEVQPTAEIVVSITGEGQVYLDEASLEVEELANALSERIKKETTPVVHVRADRLADVGVLVQVVDSVKLGGCSSFSIETMAR